MADTRFGEVADFANALAKHIQEYTVPQYGDKGADEITEYSVEVCIKHAERYLARFGKQRRDGEELLDLMKAAHYCIIAWTKFQEQKPAVPTKQLSRCGWLVKVPLQGIPGERQVIHVESDLAFKALSSAYPDLEFLEIYTEA